MGLTPKDPFELAAIRAENSISHGLEILPEDIRLLQELDGGADMLGFIGASYLINARRSMIVPLSFEADEDIEYTDMFDITFGAKFACYAKVHIGKLFGRAPVRAVCMAFSDALIMPHFSQTSEDELLYVPVLAVDTIERVSRIF